MLRRTADVLDNYLPPKRVSDCASCSADTDQADEYVVFVAPSKLQLAILDRLLSQTVLSAFLQARVQPLGFTDPCVATMANDAVDTLRKVCNAPLVSDCAGLWAQADCSAIEEEGGQGRRSI